MLLKLLGLPFSLPVNGIKFCFEKVAELAEQELYDDAVWREQLLLLQVQLEEGAIDEDEYAEREAVIMQRLREIKAYREAQLKEMLAQRGMDAEHDAPLPTEGGRRRVVVETAFGDE